MIGEAVCCMIDFCHCNIIMALQLCWIVHRQADAIALNKGVVMCSLSCLSVGTLCP